MLCRIKNLFNKCNISMYYDLLAEKKFYTYMNKLGIPKNDLKNFLF